MFSRRCGIDCDRFVASQSKRVKAQYLRIFRWHVLRYLRRHPLLGLLNVLSVALGVAVYLAMQIANQSANRAFAASVDLVAGKAELEITAPAGAFAGNGSAASVIGARRIRGDAACARF